MNTETIYGIRVDNTEPEPSPAPKNDIRLIYKEDAIICVDFDGTIVDHAFPEVGNIKPYAAAALMALKHKGYRLVLWTCRSPIDITKTEGVPQRNFLKESVDFCTAQGIEFEAINANVPGLGFEAMPKVYANIYIDDRAYKAKIDWEEIGRNLAGDCFWDFVHFGKKGFEMSKPVSR